MSDDSTTQCLLFPGIFRKPVVAQFDQREGSSDGGALLLKAADRHYGLAAGLASCLRDQRQAGKVDHSLRELVGQCIMKERPASEGRSRMRRRLRCATLCRASLRYGGASSSVPGGKGLQKNIGKSAREWHFYLEGKGKR
jgi:hypothetical protein